MAAFLSRTAPSVGRQEGGKAGAGEDSVGDVEMERVQNGSEWREQRRADPVH